MTARTQAPARQRLVQTLPLVKIDGRHEVNADPKVLFAENEKQQIAYWAATSGQFREIFFGGAAGGGKLLALSEDVATPSGWAKVGEIAPGDEVFDENGAPTTVLAVSAIEQEPVSYKLIFDDGSEVTCCEDHLWKTFSRAELAALSRRTPEYRAARRAKRPSRATGSKSAAFTAAIIARNRRLRPEEKDTPTGTVRSTREIVETLKCANGANNHAIPVAGALQLRRQELPVDPYLLGVWLGNGTALAGQVTTMDPEIQGAFEDCGFEIGKVQQKKGSKAWSFTPLGFKLQIAVADVIGNKHIPPIYLRSSSEQRLALLQGLIDTDGTPKTGKAGVDFDTTTPALAEGVAELVRSLGWKPSVTTGRAKLNGKDCGPRWRISWTPHEKVFRLSRKRDKQIVGTRRVSQFRYIVKAERVESCPMRCLQVDSPSSLFLVGRSMIPTHNSHLIRVLGVIKGLEVPGCNILLVRSTIDEVRDQMFRELEKLIPPELLGRGGIRMMPKPCAELVNGSLIWGLPGEDERVFRSWNDVNFVGIDEASDCNEKIFPTVFSRFRRKKNSPLNPVLMIASNPCGGPIYDRFVADPANNPKTTLFIPAFATDNGYIDSEDFMETMRVNMPAEEYRRMALGMWEGLRGLVYPQFKNTVGPWGSHVCDPHSERFTLDPQRSYTHVQGMDYATRNVTCIVFLAKDDETGHVFAYDEIWGRGMKLDDINRQYDEKCARHKLTNSQRFVCADHNMWISTDGFAPAEALMSTVPGHALGRRYAMPLHQADKRAQRYSTASVLLDYEKLSVLTSCPNLRDSLKGAEFKKESKAQIREGIHAEDIAPKFKDALDALGYALNWCYPPDAPVRQVSWERGQKPPLESGAYGPRIAKDAMRLRMQKEMEENGFAGQKVDMRQGDWGAPGDRRGAFVRGGF